MQLREADPELDTQTPDFPSPGAVIPPDESDESERGVRECIHRDPTTLLVWIHETFHDRSISEALDIETINRVTESDQHIVDGYVQAVHVPPATSFPFVRLVFEQDALEDEI